MLFIEGGIAAPANQYLKQNFKHDECFLFTGDEPGLVQMKRFQSVGASGAPVHREIDVPLHGVPDDGVDLQAFRVLETG